MVTPNPYPYSAPSPMLPTPISRQPVAALVMETYPGTNMPDAFQRVVPGLANPGFPPAMPGMNMMGSPQQQLQTAYNNALMARQQAEDARTAYLNLANNLNGQAYQNQMTQLQMPPAAPGGGGYPVGFQPTSVEQQQILAQQQLQQQQAALMQQQILQQQQAQQALMQQSLQQQQAFQPTPMPGQAPAMPQDLSFASLDDLNRLIAQPPSLQDKVNALAELSMRGQGTPDTYNLLKREIAADTSMLPPGEQQKANYARQAAMWTLGILNATQNAQAPTAQLPGLNLVSQVLSSPNTDPNVKVAAIQALQVINRPQDPIVQQILSQTLNDPSPNVKLRAQNALAGEAIPVPVQPLAAPAAGVPMPVDAGSMPLGTNPFPAG